MTTRRCKARLRSFSNACALTAATALLIGVSPARADDTSTAATASPSGLIRLQTSLAVRADRPAGALHLGAPIDATLMPRTYIADRAGASPVSAVTRIIPVHFRLGLEVSPSVKFDAGVDVSLPLLSLSPGLSTRIDADAIVSANFGGVTTVFPVTIDQVFTLPIPGVTKIYIGGGIGPYIGEVTRFGGKIFVGADLSSHLGVEATAHFPGFGDALFTLALRIPLG